MSAVMKQQPGTATANDAPASGEGSAKTEETMDGFHLVIEALKLNGIDTVFGLPGIPITDLTRKMQAEGLRVISFRHEQHAGNAAAGGGLSHRHAGHLPHRLGARLPQRPDRARQRDDQLLPDDPHQRLERARDRRPAAGRLRGDGPARDRQAAVQGGVSRAACRRHRRRHRARDPLGGVGPSRRRLPRLPGQALLAGDRRRGGQALADQGRRSGAAPAARARRGRARARRAEGRQAPAHHPRQGRGVRARRRRDPRPDREDRHSLPADVDGQGPAARHARAVGRGDALVRAGRGRRRDADRRAPQLAALARQGQDLGRRQRRRAQVHPGRHLADRDGQQRADRRAARRRHRLVRRRARERPRRHLGQARAPTGPARSASARRRTSPRWPRRSPRTRRR